MRRPRPRMEQKPKKRAFRGLGWSKNRKNELSEASDRLKTEKTTFRLQATDGNGKKIAVACKRNVQNTKNCVSLASESSKIEKTTFRLQATGKNSQKQPVACVFSSNSRQCLGRVADEDRAFPRSASKICLLSTSALR